MVSSDSDLQFLALAESVNDAIVGIDGSGELIYANRAASGLFGLDREELLGRALTQLMPERFRAAHLAGLSRFLSTGESKLVGRTTVEVAALHSDGREIPVELSLGAAPVGGEVRVTGVLRDITERRVAQATARAEAAVGAALASAGGVDETVRAALEGFAVELGWVAGAFWANDQDNGHLRFRAGWVAPGTPDVVLTEMQRLEFEFKQGLPGVVWHSGAPVWVPDVRAVPGPPRADAAALDDVRSAVATPVEEHGRVWGAIEFLRPDTTEPLDEVMDAVRDLADRIGQFCGRCHAEEELARAHEELIERAAELERSNTELEHFASAASHDLSEPIRTITGFARLLDVRYRDRMESDGREFLDHILEAGERADRLIGDLLDYARVGSRTEAFTKVDLGMLLEQVSGRPRFGHPGVRRGGSRRGASRVGVRRPGDARPAAAEPDLQCGEVPCVRAATDRGVGNPCWGRMAHLGR